MKGVREWAKRNWKTAVVIFQIFWLLVVIIDALLSKAGAKVPEFIYVNF